MQCTSCILGRSWTVKFWCVIYCLLPQINTRLSLLPSSNSPLKYYHHIHIYMPNAESLSPLDTLLRSPKLRPTPFFSLAGVALGQAPSTGSSCCLCYNQINSLVSPMFQGETLHVNVNVFNCHPGRCFLFFLAATTSGVPSRLLVLLQHPRHLQVQPSPPPQTTDRRA